MNTDNKKTETKQCTIPSVIKRFGLEEELLSILWETKTWFEDNPTKIGGYSEKYCKEKLKTWMNTNVL